jgi:hypothetical protein
LWLAAALPLVTWIATFALALGTGSGQRDFMIAIALSVTVWPAYGLTRRCWGGPAAHTRSDLT